MSAYNLSSIKTQQDALAARKAKLTQSFNPFRDTIIEELTRLIEEAISLGLQGAKTVSIKEKTDRFLEVTCTLNNFPLILIASDEAYHIDSMDNALYMKLFIYEDGDDNI